VEDPEERVSVKGSTIAPGDKIVSDTDNYRISLPVLRKNAITPGMLWSVIKDLIGKDMSKISLPVFINEPLTALQKAGEMMCFCDEMF
jgi:hypothetical protein